MTRRDNQLTRALSLLGPLEGRLMKLIWDGRVREPFIVRDVLALTPELAYTTVMTTLNRLADKGLLSVAKVGSHQPHKYRASGGVKEFLTDSGRAEVDRLVERYGDAALAAFAARLDRLSPATREALKRLRSR
ncbi:MAG TPA: BlaI/MecI/CopY family transcriptional regulator [Candidatus Dormibacteraeota bacterium]|nr:BlaI/MecI/CopY family transcriptional regulator [Candidatus Dormibacteraeota bacterium]